MQIETNLLAVNPGSTEILARIGDIYSDRELSQGCSVLGAHPKVAPGESGGYLEAATIYWDYFDFDNALRMLNEGRKKLGDETLYGYEKGAIYEGKRDYPRNSANTRNPRWPRAQNLPHSAGYSTCRVVRNIAI